MKQVPHGPEDKVCPLHRSKMSKVCHTCPLWMHVRGEHPNTGEPIDKWNCAIAWSPILTLEASRNSKQTTAAVEGLRNVVATNKQRSEASPLRLGSASAPAIEGDTMPPRRLT